MTEVVDGAASATVGVWVQGGTREEKLTEHGLAHLTKRMLLEGSQDHSAEEIRDELSHLGRCLAPTERERIGLVASVAPESAAEAAAWLSELVARPAFPAEALERQRQAVLEEIHADDDRPERVVDRIFLRSLWKGHGLCRPLEGSDETVSRFRRQQVERYYSRHYKPHRMVLAAAGAIDRDALLGAAERTLGSLKPGKDKLSELPPSSHSVIALRNQPSEDAVHLQAGVAVCGMRDRERHAARILADLVKRRAPGALAETGSEQTGCDLRLFSDAGCLSVRARTSLAELPTALNAILRVFHVLEETLQDAADLEESKRRVGNHLLTALERPEDRVRDLVIQETCLEELVTPAEEQGALAAVTEREVRDCAEQWFRPELMTLSILGALGDFRMSWNDFHAAWTECAVKQPLRLSA